MPKDDEESEKDVTKQHAKDAYRALQTLKAVWQRAKERRRCQRQDNSTGALRYMCAWLNGGYVFMRKCLSISACEWLYVARMSSKQIASMLQGYFLHATCLYVCALL